MLIQIGPNASGITFQNVGVSCPQCGGAAVIGDGTYTSVGEELRLDKGPLSTRVLLAELGRIAETARTEGLTTEEVLAEIADVSPDLAKKLSGLGNWPVYGLIILLFWLVKSFTFDLRVDINWLIDQAWHIAHGNDPERHLDSDPPEPLQPAKPHDRKRSPFEPSIVAGIAALAPNRRSRRQAKAQKRRDSRKQKN